MKGPRINSGWPCPFGCAKTAVIVKVWDDRGIFHCSASERHRLPKVYWYRDWDQDFNVQANNGVFTTERYE